MRPPPQPAHELASSVSHVSSNGTSDLPVPSTPPIAADGHIFLLNLDGKAAPLAVGAKPEVRWRTDFQERIAATPAIVDDTLYVRTETKLFAFKERK